jgi:hypothetical protein
VAFLQAARHHVQKKPHTPASSSGLTSCGAGGPGSTSSPISIRCHRRDRRFDQNGPALWAGAPRPSLPGAGSARTLEDDDVHRGLEA